ncbi:ribonuclease P [Alkalihalobacillus alcalophilus ATCC 27647 = CGMCC 1.3604]|uniref:Ribonuclease P protein component n=1 Tax=Alkalihalobacillus alcalophilus ATCC 27647 = CGMCC 1.3604 TaxID=1218173 RepID=A0A094WEY9_ALKAL|nr:ribonuclease P protein component [Alkalihalobacillus alcalophilus]KGA96304.1 ribonuclease P [Alkalihalobacillus alcalophilus ATCC 27647 = CGMCC 1.3604]MED1560354.1 ribonuclease P protein component [Alkalihalobacillus alcalophilus]THG89962.1 ribonuclease P [Alkalihalobacillus alcalophilus ATCC 27647 = CGMCC 1.3604]
MNKEQRIKKNEEFSLVFNKGTSVANRQFVLYALAKEGQDKFRLGLSVSKKVGNAVTRNRVKRMVRAFFQENKERLHIGYDYVVIARKPVATMEFSEVESSLHHILRKGRYIRKGK